MLVGVGGSGKQSLTRVAAFVAGFECVQIEINRGYGLPEFREDIKKLMVRLLNAYYDRALYEVSVQWRIKQLRLAVAGGICLSGKMEARRRFNNMCRLHGATREHS